MIEFVQEICEQPAEAGAGNARATRLLPGWRPMMKNPRPANENPNLLLCGSALTSSL